MLPNILLPSFIIGRWWVIPLAAVAWTVLLLGAGTIGTAEIPTTAALAAANAAVGVVAHQALLAVFRSIRDIVREFRRRNASGSA